MLFRAMVSALYAHGRRPGLRPSTPPRGGGASNAPFVLSANALSLWSLYIWTPSDTSHGIANSSSLPGLPAARVSFLFPSRTHLLRSTCRMVYALYSGHNHSTILPA